MLWKNQGDLRATPMSLRRANCLWILLSLIASLLSGSLGTKADALTMEEERKIGKQVFVEIEKV